MLAFVGCLSAQSGAAFETLTPADGLSQGYVAAVAQDSAGFLWLGTKNGLNRYDGRNFRLFRNDPFDPASLADDFVLSIEEHGDFLVLGLNQNGIDIFDKRTHRVCHLSATFPDGKKLKNCSVHKVGVDDDGQIWAAVLFQGETDSRIARLRFPEGFWEKLCSNPELAVQGDVTLFPHPALYNFFYFHFSADRRIIWMNQNGQPYRCGIDQSEAVQETLPVGMLTHIQMTNDNKGNVWLVSFEHLFCHNKDAPLGTWEHKSLPMKDGRVYPLFAIDKENQIWLWSFGKFYVIPLPDFDRPAIEPNLGFTIPMPPGSTSLLCDRSGIIWAGSVGYGLHKFNPRRNRFAHFLPKLSASSAIYSGPQGELGLFVGDKKSFWFLPDNPRLSAVIHKIVISSAGRPIHSQLITNPSGGWWMYLQTEVEAMVHHIGEDFKLEKSWWIGKKTTLKRGHFFAEGNGILWVAYTNQFVRLDPWTGEKRRFDLDPLVGASTAFQDIRKTPDGRWWLGTEVGLLEGTPETSGGVGFKIHRTVPGDRQSLRHENVACLLPDPGDPNVLWLGTKGGGLGKMDLKTGKINALTTREGLPNDVVYGVVPDDQGNLWLSSNSGIICYNPKSERMKNYTVADGLPSNEYNTFSFGKTSDGRIVFGNVEGGTVFRPEDLADNNYSPSPLFTGIEVNNAPIEPGDSSGLLDVAPAFLKKLVLPFSKNNVAFTFALPEYSSPEKNRFRYYLEGAEPEWAHESNDDRAAYLNLPPGNYRFLLMGANRDGIWCGQPSCIELVILPPWYRTWWAWLIWLTIGVFAVRWYLHFRENRQKLQHDLLLEHQEAKRLQELDGFKNRLFANITHEFRTPLTVILGNLEIEKSEIRKWRNLGIGEFGKPGKEENAKISQFLDFLISKNTLTRRNAESLLRLINQILDLSKLEDNSLKINYVQGDVVAYIRYVAESLHSFANAQNVLVRVDTAHGAGKIVMDYDPDRLLQIVHNLISNALKFTPSGGRVILRAGIGSEGEGTNSGENLSLIPSRPSSLLLTVTDTGAGIPPEDLPHIFNRFYQANNLEKAKAGGTGIGLALTKELVQLMGGEIRVESTVGKGTTFSVLLPISNNAQMETLDFQGTGSTGFVERPSPGFDRSKTSENNIGQPRLLIVEDNPDVVEYLAACLYENYQLEFAYNGRSGIEMALESIPDLIISDVMMPEKDGFEVCDTLKNDERTSHVPIILLTAKADVESRITGLKRGADAYLAKPFHQEELLVTVANLLEIRKKLQAKYSEKAIAPIIPHPSSHVPDPEDVFLQKLRSVVEPRLGEAGLAADDVCKPMGMSRSVLYAKLSALTGLSFNIYLRSLRLRKAQELLLKSEMNVSEIAYEVGYNDPRYFIRVFSEEFGKPPGEWRKQV